MTFSNQPFLAIDVSPNLSKSEDSEGEFDFLIKIQSRFYSDYVSLDNKASSSTRVIGDSVKLKLANALLKLPNSDTRYSKAMKNIKWDELGLDEHSPEELREHFNEIVRIVGTVRTLGEVVECFKKNSQKLESQNHPDRPVKPKTAQNIYVNENREKLLQKFEKEHPSASKFKFISSKNYS